VPDFIPIRFETTEPSLGFLDQVEERSPQQQQDE